MSSSSSALTPDVVILGGGIAGLWTLNLLCNQGYDAILLEAAALGSDQTIASQGMIHGGIKYTLSGALTGASEAIADMPDHWRACLRGEGDVDLRHARTLSEHFYLWSTASLGSRLGGFFASKLTRGRVEPVATTELPATLQNPAFRGKVYRLVDMVMDTSSVLRALADNYRDRIYQTAPSCFRWDLSLPDHPRLTLQTPAQTVQLYPRAFVLSAGQGNAALLETLGATAPQMQLRPLQQVMVRHWHTDHFYGHCLGAETTPRLTISSHPLADGSQVWYLGGSLAEKGADLPSEDVIELARRELAELIPWLDLNDAEWATLPVNRAEPRQRNLMRPDNAYAAWAECPGPVITAWPTKLTLAPSLAAEVLRLLEERNIRPGGQDSRLASLPSPPVARTPWATAFNLSDWMPS